ncbi:fibronectin type III domain-containing protein, partial [Planctomycetota bacterium]
MSGRLILIIPFVLASVSTINAANAGLRDDVLAQSRSPEEILQLMETGPKTQVSNETPQDGAENIYTDTVLCFRPPENALCMNPEADPNLKGPFMFDVYFSSDPCELLWIPPTIGPVDSNEEICLNPSTNRLLASTDYYWRVNVTDLNEPGDPCLYQGPVFRFTTRGSCEGWGHVYGDMDGDCFVDFVDYALFAPAWGAQEGDDEYDPNCDINLLIPDGSIDEYDLAVLANQWLMQTGPAPPSELTFGIVTSDSIELSWTDNSTVEDGFYIYINTLSGHPRTPSYINDKDDTTLTVMGLQEGTTYYFWVHSYNSYGRSPAISGSKTAVSPSGGMLIEAGKFVYRSDLSLNPALRPGSSGQWDEEVVESGDIVKIGDTYYWYYHGYQDTYQIGVATATDPSGPWTKYAGNPIIEVGPGAYDDGYVACAAFYEEAGTYYLFYSSAGISEYDNAIAVATATDPLSPWTKSEDNPILDDDSGLGFAAGMIYLCGVVKVGGTYYLYVTDADYTQCDFGPMYVFKSYSIYGPWTRHPDPVLSPGAEGQWDDGAFSEAEVLYYEGLFHTFYGGAQMEPGNEDCDAPGNTREYVKESIGYAYSYDGINFTKYEENPVIDRMDIEHDPHVSALAEVHFQIEMPYIYTVSTERWEEDWGDRDSCPWCEDLAIQVIEVNEAGWVQIMSDDFESGWGNWTDGGADAIRYTSGTYAHEGSCAINLQDDTSTSVMTTNNLDLSAYTAVKVDFWYYPVSFDDSDEDFWLQIST